MLRKRITAALMAFAAGIMVFAGEGITSEAKYYSMYTMQEYDTVEEYEAAENDMNQWTDTGSINNWTNTWKLNATYMSLCLNGHEGGYYKIGKTAKSESEYIMRIRETGADYFTFYDKDGIIVKEDGKHYSCYSNQMLQMVLENGFLTEFMPEFKKYGLLSQIYELPAGTVERNAPVENVQWLEDTYNRYAQKEKKVFDSNISTLFARTDATLKADYLTSAADITAVSTGTSLTVLGITDPVLGFYYVQLPDGTTGFIDAYYTAMPQ